MRCAIVFLLIGLLLSSCQTLQVVGNYRYINAANAMDRGNYDEAFKILNILANDSSFHDVASAKVMLSGLYLKGRGVGQSTSKAIELLETASKDPENKTWAGIAASKLGWIYFEGVEAKDERNALTVDKFKAADWFNRSVILGNDRSQDTLKLIIKDPKYYVRLNKDDFTADPGESRAPDPNALEKLLQRPEDHYPEIKKHAFHGNAKAQLALAILHAKGKVGAQNPVRAHRWLYLSAEQGNRLAQYELGNAYYKGDHIPLDLAAALYWVKKAADQNLPDAVNDYGTFVLNPLTKNVKPDPASAFELFERAAKLGSSHAMVNIGDMYRDGIGIAPDQAMARKYYELALGAGHKVARARLSKLDLASGKTPVMREKVIVERERVIVERPADQGLSSEAIFKKLNKSVFMLIVGNIKQAKSGVKPAVDGSGSAVAVTKRLALTNCHVVEKSDFVFFARDKLRGLADIVHRDKEADICIIRSREEDLVPIEASRPIADLNVGEVVYAIGAPRGLQNSISQGVLSGIRKKKGQRWLQTSAPFSPGSSGGGLFDRKGRLIGITTWIRVDKGSQGLNFASPAHSFYELAKRLGD